jgi:hypothetical protein
MEASWKLQGSLMEASWKPCGIFMEASRSLTIALWKPHLVVSLN